MESGKFKPEEEPSDIMDRIWKAYQQTPYTERFVDKHWDRLTDLREIGFIPDASKASISSIGVVCQMKRSRI